jgi:hypothetical protein
MVLALMRKLLPPGLAWLAAGWWTILPINFGALYEVHLFALIPVLASWLLILSHSNPWARGSAIALLFGASMLVRNELMVATVILALICLGWEIWLAKKKDSALPPLNYGVSYGLPLLLAGVFCFFFYTRSFIQYPELPVRAAHKHQVNMCMVYANSYQQRHSDWTKNPWTECYELMERDFGARLLSLSEMFRRNPAAVWEHFWWNIGLTLNGLQVLLFNATSGRLNPDFVPVQLGSLKALILSLVVATLWGVGLTCLYRERYYWWNFWLRDRALGWLAMLAVAVVACLIIPTQRPRPSYLFSLSLLMMALTGMSVFVITQRWLIFKRLSAWIPLVMIGVLWVTPNYYVDPAHRPPRYLLEFYRKLAPFQQIIARPDTIYLGRFADEIVGNYLGHGSPQVFDSSLLSGLQAGAELQAFLDNKKINLLYLDETLLAKFPEDPFTSSWLPSMNSTGWKLIAFQDDVGGRWMLFHRPPQPPGVGDKIAHNQISSPPIPGPFDASAVLELGDNWYPLETFNGETFRWVNNDAELIIHRPTGQHTTLSLEVEPGPGLKGQPLQFQLLDQAGQIVATAAQVISRQTVEMTLPINPGQRAVFRLHIEGGGGPTPNDLRILNFRVFRIGWAGPTLSPPGGVINSSEQNSR